MTDLLNIERINALPQLYVRQWGEKGFQWPVHDIEVQTGMLRIDVCGKLQVLHIGDVAEFRDDDGAVHDAESFYLDPPEPLEQTGNPVCPRR